MNTQHTTPLSIKHIAAFIVSATLAASATTALADDISRDTTPFVSQKSRAEVVAELENASARGQLSIPREDTPATWTAKSLKSREEVRAELRLAVARGEMNYPGDGPDASAQPQVRMAAKR